MENIGKRNLRVGNAVLYPICSELRYSTARPITCKFRIEPHFGCEAMQHLNPVLFVIPIAIRN